MIIACPSCKARYQFDESRLGERPRAKTKCGKCGATIEIENPLLSAMTLPPGTMAPPVATPPAAPGPTDTAKSGQGPGRADVGSATGRDLHKAGLIELPRDRRFSLAVIQGAATGQIFQITKTRTTIGRSGADINLDDPEASRMHASVEIIGDHALLRDLGSTNGTYVEIDRVEQHALGNHMEFRIGSHVLMFIITEVE